MNNRKSLLFVLPLIAMVLMACGFSSNISFRNERVVGSGNVTSEERTVENFERISLESTGELTIIQGDEEGITVEADDNLLPYIETRVSGHELRIGFQRNVSIETRNPIRYTLRVKDLERISVSGSGEVEAEALDTKKLSLEISGSGNVNIADLQTEDLRVRVSGSGNFELAGAAEEQDVTISGSGNYNASDLMSHRAVVNVTGSGDVTTWADEELDVRVSGHGNVGYYGKPSISQSVTGSGEVKSLGEHE